MHRAGNVAQLDRAIARRKLKRAGDSRYARSLGPIDRHVAVYVCRAHVRIIQSEKHRAIYVRKVGFAMTCLDRDVAFDARGGYVSEAVVYRDARRRRHLDLDVRGELLADLI